MCYFIDQQLIGVGVVDILPEMLCSLFFFYSRKFKKFGLGKISIIKEIEYVKEMQQYFPDF